MSFARSARRCFGGVAVLAVAGTSGFALPAMADTPDEPKNIIVMIGDGMGFNHVDASSLYDHGKSNWQIAGKPGSGDVKKQDGYGSTPSQVYENFDVQIAMSHHSLDSPKYNSADAWKTFDWAKDRPTDSAASGTALATGHKTHNGYLGVDGDKKSVRNVAEHAHDTGRATGVVSSVPFGHATPASWGAHVASRKANHEIADQMIGGPLDVIIGAGHPLFDEDGRKRTPKWEWLTEKQYDGLKAADAKRAFVEDSAGIEAIGRGENVPDRVFGLAPVATTLQFNRSSLKNVEPRNDNGGRIDGKPIAGKAPLPGEAKFNDMVKLKDMSSAALNVLSKDDDGFFTMIEGGAIDWAGHANATTGNLEEMQDFNSSVEAVHSWVEKNSSWDDTLLIVTADHETGYLSGASDDKQWTHMTGEKGSLPIDGWYSPEHTNHLVPFFAHGAGADTVKKYVRGTDPVRGEYIDNTDVASLAFDLWKEKAVPTEDPTATPTSSPTGDPSSEPTAEPTGEPSTEPSTKPTADPSQEAAPTASPTDDGSGSGSDDQANGSGDTTGGRLPRTGVELGTAGAIAAGLVALGSAAVYAARRRRQESSHES